MKKSTIFGTRNSIKCWHIKKNEEIVGERERKSKRDRKRKRKSDREKFKTK